MKKPVYHLTIKDAPNYASNCYLITCNGASLGHLAPDNENLYLSLGKVPNKSKEMLSDDDLLKATIDAVTNFAHDIGYGQIVIAYKLEGFATIRTREEWTALGFTIGENQDLLYHSTD